MTFEQFIHSVQQAEPPAGCTRHLQALWEDAKGNWQQAHRIVQHLSDRDAAWIHAYLHRKEGDLSNAQYWYERAGRTVARSSLSAEWEAIVKALLRRKKSVRHRMNIRKLGDREMSTRKTLYPSPTSMHSASSPGVPRNIGAFAVPLLRTVLPR